MKNYQELSKRVQQNPKLLIEVYDDFIKHLLSQPNQILIFVSHRFKNEKKSTIRCMEMYKKLILYIYFLVRFSCIIWDWKWFQESGSLPYSVTWQ